MSNNLFQKFGNMVSSHQTMNNTSVNILSQLAMLKNNPGGILDILLQSGKINQLQYNQLQPYRNNPEAIVNYLINNGMGAGIKMAENEASRKYGN